MMGRTNTVYAETSDTSELSLHVESILTPSNDAIWKIEYLNNIFFVFLDNGRVMYGEDIKELEYLKKDGDYLTLSHVIYTNGTYAFIAQGSSISTITIYKTQDLLSFTTCVFQNTNTSNSVCPMGIFLSGKGKIVILFMYIEDRIVKGHKFYLGVFNSIDDIPEDGTGCEKFDQIECPFRETVSLLDERRTIMYKDRLFLPKFHLGSSSYSYNCSYIISLDGNIEEETNHVDAYFIGDMMYFNINGDIYYSLNGISYSRITNYIECGIKRIRAMFAYDENQIGIFCFDIDDNTVFALADSHTHIDDALRTAVDVNEILGAINCSCMVGGYTYLGSSGGMIYKTIADYSGNNNAPNISVIKTLSAKQALSESKNYTEKKYAELEARIAALEAHIEE